MLSPNRSWRRRRHGPTATRPIQSSRWAPWYHLGGELFERRVDEAVAQGARLLVGNERRGALYSPTVIDHVDPAMTVVREETFSPVSPIIRFRNIDEAIRISNGTAYGLSSAICTNRLDYITRFVGELDVGTVNVREVPGYRLELTPLAASRTPVLATRKVCRKR